MTDEQAAPPRRVQGKYVVIGFALFGALMFGFTLWLAVKLGPAADRFHNPTRATQSR